MAGLPIVTEAQSFPPRKNKSESVWSASKKKIIGDQLVTESNITHCELGNCGASYTTPAKARDFTAYGAKTVLWTFLSPPADSQNAPHQLDSVTVCVVLLY